MSPASKPETQDHAFLEWTEPTMGGVLIDRKNPLCKLCGRPRNAHAAPPEPEQARCKTCNSPAAHLHPALKGSPDVQMWGEMVYFCHDKFHDIVDIEPKPGVPEPAQPAEPESAVTRALEGQSMMEERDNPVVALRRISKLTDAALMRSIAEQALEVVETAPAQPAVDRLTGETLARQFHETYERLAPSFGYETRPETRAFDPTTPNGRLMVAVCGEILAKWVLS